MRATTSHAASHHRAASVPSRSTSHNQKNPELQFLADCCCSACENNNTSPREKFYPAIPYLQYSFLRRSDEVCFCVAYLPAQSCCTYGPPQPWLFLRLHL